MCLLACVVRMLPFASNMALGAGRICRVGMCSLVGCGVGTHRSVLLMSSCRVDGGVLIPRGMTWFWVCACRLTRFGECVLARESPLGSNRGGMIGVCNECSVRCVIYVYRGHGVP